jgi:type I restriction enzyme, S subunit
MPIEFHRDGPWKLPEGWLWARLGEVAEILAGQSPPSNTYNVSGNGLPFFQGKTEFGEYSPTARKWCPSPERIAECGDVLISVRAPVGPTNLADVQCAIGRGLAAIRPRGSIESRWLLFALRRIEHSIADQATGTTFGGIPTTLLYDLLVPVAPAPEQRRIVARIDEMFTEIADGETALARARDDLDTWRRALLKAAVTGKLTREWRQHNRSNETGAELITRWRREIAFASGELGFSAQPSSDDLPETWAWSTVAEAGEIRLGRQRAPQHHNGRHMRPYLRVANVFEGRLDLTDVKSMNFTPEEFKIYQLQSGDLLLNEGQSPALLGRPAMYRGEIDGCCFQNTLLRFRANPGLSPKFALLVFRHYLRSGRFKREGRITTNLAHLSQKRCAAIEFPVPPAVEQTEIVGRVQLLEEQTFEQFEHIEVSAIGPLRQSVLRAAFEGRLVEQDPNDESANLLLARIREPVDSTPPRRRARRWGNAALAAE